MAREALCTCGHDRWLHEYGEGGCLAKLCPCEAYNPVDQLRPEDGEPIDTMLRHGDGTPYMDVSDYFGPPSLTVVDRGPVADGDGRVLGPGERVVVTRWGKRVRYSAAWLTALAAMALAGTAQAGPVIPPPNVCQLKPYVCVVHPELARPLCQVRPWVCRYHRAITWWVRPWKVVR